MNILHITKKAYSPYGCNTGSWCSDHAVLLKWGLLTASTCLARTFSGPPMCIKLYGQGRGYALTEPSGKTLPRHPLLSEHSLLKSTCGEIPASLSNLQAELQIILLRWKFREGIPPVGLLSYATLRWISGESLNLGERNARLIDRDQ